MLERLLKETFLKELDEIKPDDFAEPDCDKSASDSGEHVVGEMNDLEKAIYTLMNMKDRFKELALEKLTSGNFSPSEKEKLKYAFYELLAQRNALAELMWAIIRERLNLGDRLAIGVRKKFKVVWFERSECSSDCSLSCPLKGLPAGTSGDVPSA